MDYTQEIVTDELLRNNQYKINKQIIYITLITVLIANPLNL